MPGRREEKRIYLLKKWHERKGTPAHMALHHIDLSEQAAINTDGDESQCLFETDYAFGLPIPDARSGY